MKKGFFARALALLAAGGVCAGLLAGCKKLPQPPADDGVTVREGAPAPIATMEAVPAAGTWPLSPQGLCLWEGRLCFFGHADADGPLQLYTLDLAGGEEPALQAVALTLPLPQSDGQAKAASTPLALLPTAGGLYLLAQQTLLAADGAAQNRYVLYPLSPEGALGEGQELEALADRQLMGDVSCVAGDTAYVGGVGFLARLQPAQGACTLLELPADYLPQALQPLEDGRLLAKMSVPAAAGEAGSEAGALYTRFFLLAEDGTLGEALPLAQEMAGRDLQPLRLAAGANAPLVYDQSGLYRWAPDDAQQPFETVFNWMSSGLPAQDIRYVFQLAADQYAALLQTGDDWQLLRLYAVDAALLAQRQRLRVGLLNVPSLQVAQAVQTFNAAHTDAYVEIVDYSLRDDPTAAMERDLLDGQLPDVLFLTQGISNNSYIRSGLYADLYPLLDADEELARTDFLPNVLAACEYGGQLPTLTLGFQVLTLAGEEACVGEGVGWSWADFVEVQADWPLVPTPIAATDRITALHWFVQMGGSRYLDIAAGTAHFDTPYFEQLLQAAADWPQEVHITNMLEAQQEVAQGQALLAPVYLGSMRDIHALNSHLGGKAALKGFPNDDGLSGSAILPMLRIGITYTCPVPELAWQFVRGFLLPQRQDALAQSGLFPIRQDSLDKTAAAALTPPTDTADLPEEYTQANTPQENEQLLALLRSVDVLYQYDDTVLGILREEADACWSGAHTPAEAAAILQSRVQTWLDETG